ncbi:MAG: hypothetical protein LKI39_11770 [Bacteroides sp.]|jgi:hypothetical protein|nr:hypothetical protein [Bacteroides sp.]MCI1683221.1 hypothetical protein [Bacteroides sp.]
MKYIRIFLTVAVIFSFCSAFSFKHKPGKDKEVYAFGMAASFNDTVVYYTSIQKLDSVKLGKNGFLPRREAYTSQLKDYLAYNLSSPNYTCMIYFSKNKSKLEKEEIKVKDKYKSTKSFVLVPIDSTAFKFTKPKENN